MSFVRFPQAPLQDQGIHQHGFTMKKDANGRGASDIKQAKIHHEGSDFLSSEFVGQS
jgi:hypothetical protein